MNIYVRLENDRERVSMKKMCDLLESILTCSGLKSVRVKENGEKKYMICPRVYGYLRCYLPSIETAL